MQTMCQDYGTESHCKDDAKGGGGCGAKERSTCVVCCGYIPPTHFSPTNFVDTLFFLYINPVDRYTVHMDEVYRQQLLKSLYEQAQKEQAPGYAEKLMELQTLGNPERGFLGTDNTWHKPFQTTPSVNETELNAINKASVASRGVTFDKLSQQDKLKMLMSLQQINPPIITD